MIADEITLFKEIDVFEESLNKYSCEYELESQEQARSFLEEYEEEKVSKEISILISAMEESTTDSIHIHISETILIDNSDEEKEELFMIISRGSLGVPLKPRPVPQSKSVNTNPSLLSKSIKQKSQTVLIHRPIPRKK